MHLWWRWATFRDRASREGGRQRHRPERQRVLRRVLVALEGNPSVLLGQDSVRSVELSLGDFLMVLEVPHWSGGSLGYIWGL